MLGVSEQQLRSWERHGLIRGEATFSFSDLIALKTLQKLRENRVPPRRIGRALTALKKKLSHVEQPLSELKILSDGRTITVQIAGQKMEALTGQMLFNFDASELGSLRSFESKPVTVTSMRSGRPRAIFKTGWRSRRLARRLKKPSRRIGKRSRSIPEPPAPWSTSGRSIIASASTKMRRAST